MDSSKYQQIKGLQEEVAKVLSVKATVIFGQRVLGKKSINFIKRFPHFKVLFLYIFNIKIIKLIYIYYLLICHSWQNTNVC